jgi:RHS repeat-associated protein
VAYVYDAANQLKEILQGSPTGAVLASLTYDANGNLTQKSEGSSTTAFTYDPLNRLSQVTGTGQPTQSYVYDHDGRRIQKTVGTAASFYLYSGPDIVAEYRDTWTAASSMTTHGPTKWDDPLIRASGSTAQYYHQDGLGSVVAVSNGTGGTDGTARYDAWGVRLSGTGVIPQYGYTGREPDGTGLIYYRGRYYDPSIGRFTQRDPIGLAGGLNQYAYVNNNPTNFTDPMGTLAFNPALTNVATGSTSYYASTTSGLSVGLGGLSADWQSLASVSSSTGTGLDPRSLVAGPGAPAPSTSTFEAFGHTFDLSLSVTFLSTNVAWDMQGLSRSNFSASTVIGLSVGFGLDLMIDPPHRYESYVSPFIGPGRHTSIGTNIVGREIQGLNLSIGPSIGIPFGVQVPGFP